MSTLDQIDAADPAWRAAFKLRVHADKGEQTLETCVAGMVSHPSVWREQLMNYTGLSIDDLGLRGMKL